MSFIFFWRPPKRNEQLPDVHVSQGVDVFPHALAHGFVAVDVWYRRPLFVPG